MPKGIYKRTEEARKAIGRASLGRTPWNKGKKIPEMSGENYSKEQREATRIRMKGNKYTLGMKHTEEWKEMMREKMKGRKRKAFSSDWKKKISLSHLGFKHSEETKIKMSLSRKGEKSHCWKKDRSSLQRYNEANKDRRSSAYRNWRLEVYKRDNYKCKINNLECKGRLEAHHILSYTKFPNLKYDINNGITLCHFHHPRVREEEKRLSPYFKELVSVSK